MNRTLQLLRSDAGTSSTKASACFGCGQMRPVSIQRWNKKTQPGSMV